MRTTDYFAAAPRPLHWQGFTHTYTAQPSPPCVWHHTRASDARTTVWCDGMFWMWVPPTQSLISD
jgi:hypothetical protein